MYEYDVQKKYDKDDTLLKLSALNNNFCKFSQSVKGRSIEKVFIAYTEGKVVTAGDMKMGLSFVASESIGRCYLYGDQVTIFDFSYSELKKTGIADCHYNYTDNELKEYKAEKLLVKKNLSLSLPSTIKWIIDESNDHNAMMFLRGKLMGDLLIDRLLDYGFENSYSVIKHIQDNFDVENPYPGLVLKNIRNSWAEICKNAIG